MECWKIAEIKFGAEEKKIGGMLLNHKANREKRNLLKNEHWV